MSESQNIFYEFLATAIADGFSLQFEEQQVFSSLLDSFSYFLRFQ